MRICFFSLNRLSFEGGAENYIGEAGSELSRRAHEVYYLGDCRFLLKFFPWVGFIAGSANFKDSFKAWRIIDNLPSEKEGTQKLIKYRELPFRSLIPLTKARREIKDFLKTCDFVLVKNEIPEMIFFRLLGKDLFKKSVLLIFTSLKYKNNNFRAKIHNFFYGGWFYKKLLSLYRAVIVSNKYEQNLIPKIFNYPTNKIYCIPYGLDNRKLTSPILNYNQRFVILFVGRMEEQKGIDFLDLLWRSLSFENDFENMRLIIAGDGPKKEIAENLAKKYRNVKYEGFVKPGEMPELYAKGDLIIIPSRWETFSYACLEAQAHGLPAVAFNIPGPQDIINDKITGRLIEPENLKDFKEAILEYHRFKKQGFKNYSDLKNKIFQETKDNFSIEKVANDWEGIFTSIV